MMKKAAFKWIAAFLLFLNLFPLMAEAKADIPDPAGDIYVQDFAGLLSSEQKAELNKLGRNLDDATTAQVAVLTVDTLDGTSIEEYSNEAFREYGIGSEEEDNGVLLVIAVDDQAVRIEVGYGLEGALPDGKVGRILDEYTIPYLQDGQYDQAIIETCKVLYNDVATEYNWDGEQVDTVPYEEQGDNPLWLILIGIVIVYFKTMLNNTIINTFYRVVNNTFYIIFMAHLSKPLHYSCLIHIILIFGYSFEYH